MGTLLATLLMVKLPVKAMHVALFAVGIGQNTHSATLFPPSREAIPSAKAAHKRSSGSGDKMLMCAFETG